MKTKAERIVESIVRKMLKEADDRSGWTISYYATVGEHGETGKRYSDFNSAVKDAIRQTKDADFMDGLEYVGVEPFGNASEFAVIFATKGYLQTALRGIDDPAAKKAFQTAYTKALQTGKPQKGNW